MEEVKGKQKQIDTLFDENQRLQDQMKRNAEIIYTLADEIAELLCPLKPGTVIYHEDFPTSGAKILKVYPRGPYFGDSRVGFHLKVEGIKNEERVERVYQYYEQQNFRIISD